MLFGDLADLSLTYQSVLGSGMLGWHSLPWCVTLSSAEDTAYVKIPSFSDIFYSGQLQLTRWSSSLQFKN